MKVYRKVHRASCQRTQEQRIHTPTPSRFISSSPLYPCKPAARSYVIRPKHKSDSVTWKEGDACASTHGENVFFISETQRFLPYCNKSKTRKWNGTKYKNMWHDNAQGVNEIKQRSIGTEHTKKSF